MNQEQEIPVYNSMSMQQLVDVLKFALQNNSPMLCKPNRKVKYVDPVIDLRDGRCFSVKFRTYGGTFVFNSQTADLYDECMQFLNQDLHGLTIQEKSEQLQLF